MQDLAITITDNRTGESFTVEFAKDEPKRDAVEQRTGLKRPEPFDAAGFTTYPALGNPDSDGPDGEFCPCVCHEFTLPGSSYFQSTCKCRRPADAGYPDC